MRPGRDPRTRKHEAPAADAGPATTCCERGAQVADVQVARSVRVRSDRSPFQSLAAPAIATATGATRLGRRVHLGSGHAVRRLRGRGRSRTAVLHGLRRPPTSGRAGRPDPAPPLELAPPGGHPMFDPVTGQLLSTLPPPPPKSARHRRRRLRRGCCRTRRDARLDAARPGAVRTARSDAGVGCRLDGRPRSTSRCGRARPTDPAPGGGALGERRRRRRCRCPWVRGLRDRTVGWRELDDAAGPRPTSASSRS